MIDCHFIDKIATTLPLIQECDVVGNGSLRLLTPFQYPNGSQIDLFIEEDSPLFEGRFLSDLGQTTSYLLDLQVKPWASNKRRQIIEDVCRSLEVRWLGGRLMIPLEGDDPAQISQSMLRLAQACIRVSDLQFSARIWAAGSFRDELEEFINSIELRYESDVIEVGKRAQEIKFDFRVYGESNTSLVQSLSAGSTQSAHSIATETFVRWFDLGPEKKGAPRHVTVVDESSDVFKEYDINRLDKYSTVFWFPADQDQLTSALRS
jgi:Domain of unknown function DUF1828